MSKNLLNMYICALDFKFFILWNTFFVIFDPINDKVFFHSQIALFFGSIVSKLLFKIIKSTHILIIFNCSKKFRLNHWRMWNCLCKCDIMTECNGLISVLRLTTTNVIVLYKTFLMFFFYFLLDILNVCCVRLTKSNNKRKHFSYAERNFCILWVNKFFNWHPAILPLYTLASMCLIITLKQKE